MTAGETLVNADLHRGCPCPPAEAFPPRGETDLIDRFRQNVPGSFEQVVEQFEQRISRLTHRLLGWRDGADAQDIVQDVFLAALKHRTRFRGNAGLGTWLTAITINCCRSHQRRMRLRHLLFRRIAEGEPSTKAWDASASAERSATIRAAVQALPPRDREVVVLRYFESLSLTEIAGVTRQSKNAVEVRLHRARNRLAGVLGDWHREEST